MGAVRKKKTSTSTRASRPRPDAWAATLMKIGARLFPIDNPYGVFAYTVGHRERRGRQVAGEVTLVSYVARKSPHAEITIKTVPISFEGEVRRMVPDVVAVGAVARTSALAAPSMPFEGLFAGAQIRADGAVRRHGGVGAILGEQGAPMYLLTAGHLFAAGEVGATVSCARGPASPVVPIGTLVLNHLDEGGQDVAVVALDETGVQMAIDGRGSYGPQLAGHVAREDATNVDGQAFLPVANAYSGVVRTNDQPFTVHVVDDVRGRYTVSNALVTAPTVGDQEGDSGTVLFHGITDALALGICVGRCSTMSIFESTGDALTATRERLGRSKLAVWT